MPDFVHFIVQNIFFHRRLSTSTASSGFESRKESLASSLESQKASTASSLESRRSSTTSTFESRKASTASSSSVSTLPTDVDEDVEEESAVTRIKSNQQLDEVLNGEFCLQFGHLLIVTNHIFASLLFLFFRARRKPTVCGQHRSQLVSCLSQVVIGGF